MDLYREKETDGTGLCYVYTPAGYEKNTKKQYPILGVEIPEDESECVWIHQGKIANIADRLMADGEIPEMILVMQKCSEKQNIQIPEKIFRKYRVVPREDAQAVIRKEKLYVKKAGNIESASGA